MTAGVMFQLQQMLLAFQFLISGYQDLSSQSVHVSRLVWPSLVCLWQTLQNQIYFSSGGFKDVGRGILWLPAN